MNTEEIMDLLKQCSEMGVYTVEFLGGEPFCRDDLNQLIDYAKSLGLGVVINTNATLITKDWLKEYASKVMLFKIGFDGEDANTNDSFRVGDNAYEKMISAVQSIQDYGIDVCLIMTLHKNNVKKIEECVRKSSELLKRGVFTITILTPRGRAENISDWVLTPGEIREAMVELRCLKNKYDRKDGSFLIKEELPESILLDPNLKDFANGIRVCTAAVTQMGISPDGWAYPCTTMIGLRNDDHNVRKHSLYDIWNYSSLFSCIRNREGITGKCAKCKYLYKCGGGCRYAAWAINNDLSSPDPFCWYSDE